MQSMKINKLALFFDSIIVLLNLAASRGNYLLFWIIGRQISTPFVVGLAIIIDLIYLLFRFRKPIHRDRRFSLPLFFLFGIHIINLLNVIVERRNFTYPAELLFLMILFCVILMELSSIYLPSIGESSVKQVSKGYVWLALISIIGVFVSFVLLYTVGIKRVPITVDYMLANDEYYQYYFSYFSVVSDTELRVPFFQDFGVLCGMYHEPHIFALNVFPCLFLLLGFAKNHLQTIILIFAMVLCVFFAGSATNIIALTLCIIVFSLLGIKRRFLGTAIAVTAIVLLALAYNSYDTTFADFLTGRFDELNSSQLYSRNLLEFAFTPKTLFGTNILSTTVVDDFFHAGYSSSDVGFLAFFLNIGFIITYLINTIKLLLSKQSVASAVGYASLYYLLHSAKVGLMMYVNLLSIIFVFIQFLALETYGRIKTSK